MKYATKKNAKDIIDWVKKEGNTQYFDGTLSMTYMKEMLQNRMGFGVPESNTIIAALVLVGAKFKTE